jgi:two-component system NtrC family sensor kinase
MTDKSSPAIIYETITSGPALATILIVDDEPEIADSLSEFLSRQMDGYRVLQAGDGRQAITILEASSKDPSQTIDLVLLDVRMPVVSGPEVLAWLRGHPILRFTRVIMLTAAAGPEEKVEALTAGADDYITKPYYPQELLARVRTILRTQQLEKQLQRQSQQLAALNRVNRAVTARLATSEVLNTAAEGAEDVLGADLVAIFMADKKQDILRCRHVHPSSGKIGIANFSPIPVGVGALGQAFQEGSSLTIFKPETSNQVNTHFDLPTGYKARSILAAPLFVRGKAVGLMAAYSTNGGPYNEVDRRLFSSLASGAGRAIEITWLFQSVKKRQEELLDGRNRLQAIIDGIPHPIYTISDKWQVMAVNQAKVASLDLPMQTLAGQKCYQLFFGRLSPCEHCYAATSLMEREAKRWSLRLVDEVHRVREWDINAYPIPGATSSLTQAVVVWQDRTEERQLENSLMQAGKLAAIGQLAAGVAHEINNPLTAITANAQMLQMSISQGSEHYESVDLIVRAGDRAAKVIRGLLDFARQTQYEFEPSDLNDSILEALSLVSYQFTSAHIDVHPYLADELPKIDASWEHLQSVWLNLFINARDALQDIPGSRRIDINTQLEPDDDFVLVTISDNGQGMTEAELERVFEPFFTTKAPGSGTGLGLATCHRIVEQHGGQIEVVSQPNKGASFFIRLPLQYKPKTAEG